MHLVRASVFCLWGALCVPTVVATPVGPILWDSVNNGAGFTGYTPNGPDPHVTITGFAIVYGIPSPSFAEFFTLSPLSVCFGTACSDDNPFGRSGAFMMGRFYGRSTSIVPGTGISSATVDLNLIDDFGVQKAKGMPTMHTHDFGMHHAWWFFNQDGSYSNVFNLKIGHEATPTLWAEIAGDEANPVYKIVGFTDPGPDGFLSEIPEPATYSMLGLALAVGVGLFVHQRRANPEAVLGL